MTITKKPQIAMQAISGCVTIARYINSSPVDDIVSQTSSHAVSSPVSSSSC